jgi:hypothetical protein
MLARKFARELSMKVFRAAAVLVLLTGPAYAQMQTPNINLLDVGPTKSPEQIEQEQARDKAYKDSLKTIPDAKVSSDPWGNVRSDSKSAPAKSAAPKPKSATAATTAPKKTGSNTPN